MEPGTCVHFKRRSADTNKRVMRFKSYIRTIEVSSEFISRAPAICSRQKKPLRRIFSHKRFLKTKKPFQFHSSLPAGPLSLIRGLVSLFQDACVAFPHHKCGCPPTSSQPCFLQSPSGFHHLPYTHRPGLRKCMWQVRHNDPLTSATNNSKDTNNSMAPSFARTVVQSTASDASKKR